MAPKLLEVNRENNTHWNLDGICISRTTQTNSGLSKLRYGISWGENAEQNSFVSNCGGKKMHLKI